MKLKFRNTIFVPGDDIVLLQNLDEKKEVYAKIVAIAKIPSVQFPVLLVTWYFTKLDQIVQ